MTDSVMLADPGLLVYVQSDSNTNELAVYLRRQGRAQTREDTRSYVKTLNALLTWAITGEEAVSTQYCSVQDDLLAKLRIYTSERLRGSESLRQIVERIAQPNSRLLVRATVTQHWDPTSPQRLLGTTVGIYPASDSSHRVVWEPENGAPTPALIASGRYGLAAKVFPPRQLQTPDLQTLEIAPPFTSNERPLIEFGLKRPTTDRPALHTIVCEVLDRLDATLSDHLKMTDTSPFRLLPHTEGYVDAGFQDC